MLDFLPHNYAEITNISKKAIKMIGLYDNPEEHPGFPITETDLADLTKLYDDCLGFSRQLEAKQEAYQTCKNNTAKHSTRPAEDDVRETFRAFETTFSMLKSNALSDHIDPVDCQHLLTTMQTLMPGVISKLRYLEAQRTALSTARQEEERAQMAVANIEKQRDTACTNLRSKLHELLNSLVDAYVNNQFTDELIFNALQIPLPPYSLTDIQVNALPGAVMRITWNRSGNPTSVNYRIYYWVGIKHSFKAGPAPQEVNTNLLEDFKNTNWKTLDIKNNEISFSEGERCSFKHNTYLKQNVYVYYRITAVIGDKCSPTPQWYKVQCQP